MFFGYGEYLPGDFSVALGDNGRGVLAVVVEGNGTGQGRELFLHAIMSNKPVGKRSVGGKGGLPCRHCMSLIFRPTLLRV